MARVNLSLCGGTLTICTRNRSAKAVSAPPPCEKIQLMSGYFCEVPLNTRLAMVRVVSVPNSTAEPATFWTRLMQQLASVGCVETVALRRRSASHDGAN